MLKKNVSLQKLFVFVGDDLPSATRMTGITGAASLSAKIMKDGGAPVATDDVAPTELDATDLPGVYYYNLTAAETNADDVSFVLLNAASNKSYPNVLDFKSVEDWESTVLGASWVTGTDDLDSIRDLFDASLSPVMSTALGVTELSGTGWLSRVSSKVRRWVDEPTTSSKFAPDVMLEMIEASIRELFADVLINAENQLVIRYDLVTVADQQEYMLPPNVGQILRVAKIDTTTDRQEWEVRPSTVWDPQAYGWTIEGNMLRFTQKDLWSDEPTLRIEYIPNGDIKPHLATVADVSTDIDATGTIITLPATVTDGTLDTRENAYGGYIMRVLSASEAASNFEQLSMVKSYDRLTRQITLYRPLSPVPSTGTMVYELAPVMPTIFEDVLSLHVARQMATSEGNDKRHRILTQRYIEAARAFRIFMTKVQAREATRYDNRGYDNTDLRYYWGYTY